MASLTETLFVEAVIDRFDLRSDRQSPGVATIEKAPDDEALTFVIQVTSPRCPAKTKPMPLGNPATATTIDPKTLKTWGTVARNDTCPCGSGKKYKHCHGTYATDALSRDFEGAFTGQRTIANAIESDPKDKIPNKLASEVANANEAYERGDYATSLRQLCNWPRQGNALAQSNLGSMYASGRGVSQNNAEAMKWFQLAAKQGFPPGQSNLGTYLRDGRSS